MWLRELGRPVRPDARSRGGRYGTYTVASTKTPSPTSTRVCSGVSAGRWLRIPVSCIRSCSLSPASRARSPVHERGCECVSAQSRHHLAQSALVASRSHAGRDVHPRGPSSPPILTRLAPGPGPGAIPLCRVRLELLLPCLGRAERRLERALHKGLVPRQRRPHRRLLHPQATSSPKPGSRASARRWGEDGGPPLISGAPHNMQAFPPPPVRAKVCVWRAALLECVCPQEGCGERRARW